jgi:hypothetical protein
LKNVKTPKQRIFFHCAALKILEIRQDSCEFLPCPAKKSLVVGHSAIYQTSPKQGMRVKKSPDLIRSGLFCVSKRMLRIFFEKGDRAEFGPQSTFSKILRGHIEWPCRI